MYTVSCHTHHRTSRLFLPQIHHLRKAPKLTYRALHPGNNKQNVPLALAVFDPTTTAALLSYFPDEEAAAGFLTLIFKWWTVCNSKQKTTNNWLGHAAVMGDQKPEFLRKLATWFEDWQNMNFTHCTNITPSAQTSSAMVITLRCVASLTEDLLNEGYHYVLTGRMQTDEVERHIGKVRGIGSRFLVGLIDVIRSENIILIQSLLRESYDIWDESLKPDAVIISPETVESVVGKMKEDIEACHLGLDSAEVSTVVGGYVQKQLLSRTKCDECKKILKPSSSSTAPDVPQKYLYLLSRGGLITPSTSMAKYVAKSFAIMDVVEDAVHRSSYRARPLAEKILEMNKEKRDFVCKDCEKWGVTKTVGR